MRRIIAERVTGWRLAVAIGCAYEIVALFSNRIPTITQWSYRAKNHTWARFLFWLAAGASLHHFYIEGEMHKAIEDLT